MVNGARHKEQCTNLTYMKTKAEWWLMAARGWGLEARTQNQHLMSESFQFRNPAMMGRYLIPLSIFYIYFRCLPACWSVYATCMPGVNEDQKCLIP